MPARERQIEVAEGTPMAGASPLSAVLKRMPLPQATVSAAGRLAYANPAFIALLGLRRELGSGIRAEAVFPPEERPQFRADFESNCRSGLPVRRERRVLSAEGAPLWAETSLVSIDRTGPGEATIVLQLVDISREKRAEAALPGSEERWSFALEDVGVWDHDIRTDRMFYSQRWRTMRGFAPDEEIDGALEVWLARLHPDDRERVLSTVKKQDSGEHGFETLEYRERHRDGHYISVLSRGRPVERLPDGTPVRTVGTDTDITVLKDAEASLAREKERLRVTLDAIGDGVISMDGTGRVSFLNPAAEAITGLAAAKVRGTHLETVLPVAGRAEVRRLGDAIAAATRGLLPKGLRGELGLATESGATRDLRYSVSPVRYDAENIIGAVVVLQDVSESRALERELAYAAAHDAMTGLANRSALEREAEVLRATARRDGTTHALCFIDLDRFKPVNDRAGHAAGDALLCEAAALMRRAVRAGDLVARLGGDEFVILLPDCSLGDAKALAGGVVRALATTPFAWQGDSFQVGASIGVVPIVRASPPVAALLAEADAAAYRAKARGGGCVVVASEPA